MFFRLSFSVISAIYKDVIVKNNTKKWKTGHILNIPYILLLGCIAENNSTAKRNPNKCMHTSIVVTKYLVSSTQNTKSGSFQTFNKISKWYQSSNIIFKPVWLLHHEHQTGCFEMLLWNYVPMFIVMKYLCSVSCIVLHHCTTTTWLKQFSSRSCACCRCWCKHFWILLYIAATSPFHSKVRHHFTACNDFSPLCQHSVHDNPANVSDQAAIALPVGASRCFRPQRIKHCS
jgi:hypothetical protein